MTSSSLDVRQRSTRHVVLVGLRLLIAVCLVVDAVVHLRLAGGYQQSSPDGIGAGNLFRIEAVVAVLVAVWVVWRGSRASLVAALAVALSAVVAVVLYRYVNVPAFGPLPAMYEPVWFPEKAVSAIAEGVAAAAAALALLQLRRRPARG